MHTQVLVPKQRQLKSLYRLLRFFQQQICTFLAAQDDLPKRRLLPGQSHQRLLLAFDLQRKLSTVDQTLRLFRELRLFYFKLSNLSILFRNQ